MKCNFQMTSLLVFVDNRWSETESTLILTFLIGLHGSLPVLGDGAALFRVIDSTHLSHSFRLELGV